MDKENYREELLKLDEYVKYFNVCKTLHISYSNLRQFKNGDDRKMSIKALKRIKDFIDNKYEVESDINNIEE